MIGPFTARIAGLCQQAARRTTGDDVAELDELSGSLAEPLRVAVAGRVNAGKSTIVNALVGRRVAPTDVSECTRLVTWFRYSPSDRFDVVFRDGGVVSHRLDPDGRIPPALECDIAAVERLDVWLSAERLRHLTIIDTPGLSSQHEENSARTEQVLLLERDSQSAVAQSEAVLFVFTQALRADEVEAITNFRAVTAGTASNALNAIGVLSKADTISGTSDRWADACLLAARHAERLRHEVAAVVPIVGLLAETAETGAFTETDAAAVRGLATLDDATSMRLMASVDRFVTVDAPVSTSVRRRLLDRLALFGIERAIDSARAGGTSAPSIQRALLAASNLDGLHRAIEATFRRRADVLKAASALAAVERIAYRADTEPDARRWLVDELERLRLAPEMHGLAELDAAQQVVTGAVILPPALDAELRTFVASTEPAEQLRLTGACPDALAAAAKDRSQRWRAFANGAAPRQAGVAMVMHRAHQLLWERLESADARTTST
ncbi:MAG: dynamin family protein [Ilumatobacteraceae bacterium]